MFRTSVTLGQTYLKINKAFKPKHKITSVASQIKRSLNGFDQVLESFLRIGFCFWLRPRNDLKGQKMESFH
jgi:hypothetical protein